MEKYKAIPDGYMTVGEVAKKMGITVRTLQYYDKEGLLSPSAESEGGRRLYTDKDLVALHQIISLKSLGFSLDDIKQRLTSLETPADVANALAKQADDIRREIERLTDSLTAIERLKAEVLQMQTVSYKKYADIIFLDEPTAGLDVEGRLSLHEQIRKLKLQGKTIVLASHDMAEVETLCDRIAILSHGNIAFCGTASELTDKVGKKYFIHIKTQQGDSNLKKNEWIHGPVYRAGKTGVKKTPVYSSVKSFSSSSFSCRRKALDALERI